MAKINGAETRLSAPVTVGTYLAEHSYRPDRIAVELNGRILPRQAYGTAMLGDDDVMEIVSFVGGG